MHLSEEILYESFSNPHPRDQNLNRANLFENETDKTYYGLKLFRSIS